MCVGQGVASHSFPFPKLSLPPSLSPSDDRLHRTYANTSFGVAAGAFLRLFVRLMPPVEPPFEVREQPQPFLGSRFFRVYALHCEVKRRQRDVSLDTRTSGTIRVNISLIVPRVSKETRTRKTLAIAIFPARSGVVGSLAIIFNEGKRALTQSRHFLIGRAISSSEGVRMIGFGRSH